MGKNSSVIQINGSRFDASTGQVIGGRKGPVIDGLVRRARTAPIIKKPVQKVAAFGKSSLSRKVAHGPAQAVHHRTQRSKTLMRKLVATPTMPKRPVNELNSVKSRSSAVSPARLAKAMSVRKHGTVSHFASPSASKASHHHTHSQAVRGEVISQSGGSAAAAVKPMPSVVANISSQRLDRMLDEALIKADAHKKMLSGRFSSGNRFWQKISALPSWLVVGTTVLVLVVVAAFFAWRNVPQLSTKFASFRAHVSASIPSYKPDGFSIAGPAVADSHSVTMHYKSAGGSYSIKEEKSTMNATTLMAASDDTNQKVQTALSNGVPILMFSDKAQCASDGKLMTVLNHNNVLAPGELLNVAKGVCRT